MSPRTSLAVAVTLLFWASAFAGIRAGLHAYGPGELALLRFGTASLVLLLFVRLTRPKAPRLRDVPFIAFFGFLGITFYHVCLNYGEITVTAGSASFIIGTVPVFSAIMAAVFLGEHINRVIAAGIGLSFAGVALIAAGEAEGSILEFDRGTLFILAAAIATSVFFVFQKPFLARYRAVEFTTYAIWTGTAFMLVFLPGLIDSVRKAPLEATLAGVYLGVFPSAVSYVTWAYAISEAPVSRVTAFMYLTPVLACFIAWVWLGETPSVLSFAGGFIALCGVAVVNQGFRRRSREP